MIKQEKKRNKLVEDDSSRLTPEEKKEIRKHLRSQARIIIECFELVKVNE